MKTVSTQEYDKMMDELAAMAAREMVSVGIDPDMVRAGDARIFVLERAQQLAQRTGRELPPSVGALLARDSTMSAAFMRAWLRRGLTPTVNDHQD